MKITLQAIALALALAGTSQAECDHFDVPGSWGIRAYGKKDCIGKVEDGKDHGSGRCHGIQKTPAASFHMFGTDACAVYVYSEPGCSGGNDFNTDDAGSEGIRWWTENSLSAKNHIRSWKAVCGSRA